RASSEPPVHCSLFTQLGSKAGATPTATRGIGIVEREPGALHRRDVVDRHAIQVLRAEAVNEHTHPGGVEDQIIVQRALFDIEAVLEPGAAAWEHAEAESCRVGGNVLCGDEFPNFLGGPWAERDLESLCLGLLLN